MTQPSQTDRLPALVGLCPGAHLGHFYMPLDVGDSVICPECDERMVVYSRAQRGSVLAFPQDIFIAENDGVPLPAPEDT